MWAHSRAEKHSCRHENKFCKRRLPNCPQQKWLRPSALQSLLQTAREVSSSDVQTRQLCSVIAGDRLFGLNISSLLPPLVHPPSILLCLLALTVGLYRVLTDSLLNTSVLLKLFLLTISILQGFFPLPLLINPLKGKAGRIYVCIVAFGPEKSFYFSTLWWVQHWFGKFIIELLSFGEFSEFV